MNAPTEQEIRESFRRDFHPDGTPRDRDEIEANIRKLNEELKTKRVGSKSREDREIAKDRWTRLLKATKEAQQ